MNPISLLGICGSPRPRGNSRYLLELAMEEAQTGRRASACSATSSGSPAWTWAMHLVLHLRQAQWKLLHQDDDFGPLRDKWAAADAIIYSVPVYHLGIPGQLKCFIDRLGNSLWSYYGGVVSKSLRVMGASPRARTCLPARSRPRPQLIHHTLVMGGIPVTGDPWESYIAASGWTRCGDTEGLPARPGRGGGRRCPGRRARCPQPGRRVAQMALLVRAGGEALRDELAADGGYSDFPRSPAAVCCGTRRRV